MENRGITWLSEKDSKGNYYWQKRNAHPNYAISTKYAQDLMARIHYSNQDPFTNLNSIEELENGLLRFKYFGKPALKPELAMTYQFTENNKRPTAGSMVWESKNVKFENVKISYLHGFGFLVQMSEDVFFDKLRLEPDMETGKSATSYADGIHVSGAKGKIQISNSYFTNTHDDPINIHGTFTRVEKRINDNTLKLLYVHKQQGGFRQFYPGDKVIFYSRDTLSSQMIQMNGMSLVR